MRKIMKELCPNTTHGLYNQQKKHKYKMRAQTEKRAVSPRILFVIHST